MVRDLILTTAPGLEAMLAEEAGTIVERSRISQGRVYAKGFLKDIARINGELSLLHRAFIVLKEFEIPISTREEAFERIKQELMEVPREERLEPSKPFAIRGERYPKEYPHPFRSVDLGIPAGSAVIERLLKKTGRRIPVDLKRPVYEIFVEVVKEKVRVMINTTGESMHKRGYRIRGHPASLSTTIARAMAKLAGNLSDVCDPVCGSGTLLLESRLERQNVPVGRIRSKTYGRLYGHLKPLKDLRREDRKNERREQKLTFGDRSSKHIDAAIANSFHLSRLAEAPKGYRVPDLASYKLRDVRFLRGLECSVMLANPPYGLRLGSKESVKDTYEALFRLARGKTFVLITPREDLVRLYAPEADLELSVLHGDLPVKIYVRRGL